MMPKRKTYSTQPPKTNMVHLKMDPWKRRFLVETIISRFHVEFGGCIQQLLWQTMLKVWKPWNKSANSNNGFTSLFIVIVGCLSLLTMFFGGGTNLQPCSKPNNDFGNPCFITVCYKLTTLQGINISHLGKRKIIFKMAFLGDMLVSSRV